MKPRVFRKGTYGCIFLSLDLLAITLAATPINKMLVSNTQQMFITPSLRALKMPGMSANTKMRARPCCMRRRII